jgi:hypothetical protein
MTKNSTSFLKGVSSEVGNAVELGASLTVDALQGALLKILEDTAAQREASAEGQRQSFLQTEAALQLMLSVSREIPALAGRFASVASLVAFSAGLGALQEARTVLQDLKRSGE